MIVNGLSPGIAINDTVTPVPDRDLLQKQEIEQEIRIERQKLEKDTAEKNPKKDSSRSSEPDMSEYYLKELLFLMSSRGNTATIEKLAQLLKKERDTLTGVK